MSHDEMSGDESGESVVADVLVSHPSLPLRRTLSRVPEVRVRLEFFMPTQDGVPVAVMTVRGEASALGEFEASLSDDPTVEAFERLSERDGASVYRVEDGGSLTVGPLVAESGGRILELTITREGTRVEVRFPDRGRFGAFRDACREAGMAFDLRRLYRPTESEGYGLTETQRRTLLVAREAGYFDDPREVSLADLADELEISPTAVGRRLRRATAALIDATLADGS